MPDDMYSPNGKPPEMPGHEEGDIELGYRGFYLLVVKARGIYLLRFSCSLSLSLFLFPLFFKR